MSDVMAILQMIIGFLRAHTMAAGDIGSINYWLTLIIVILVSIKVGVSFSK